MLIDIKPEEFQGICDFCRNPGIKASKDTNYKGITLLSPEGLWICERCLETKKRGIIIGPE